MAQPTITIQLGGPQQQQQPQYPQQYPPQQYPPQQYPPQQYPPQQYPPQQYPPQQYPPQQYPPQQYPQQHPPQQYPPQQYPPQQYPPQPQQYPPQQYPPQQAQPASPEKKLQKGFDRLATRDGIFIKQKFDLAEALTGCDQNNTYNVFPLSKGGEKKGKKLFQAKEKSSCFAKYCMAPDCKPFQLKINLQDDNEELDNEPFLFVDRPCKCTIACCNRPEMLVSYVEDGKNEYIGKVMDPYTLCNIINEIYDKDGNLKYKIEASCCQIGLHCKGPCDCCETIDFDIKSPSGEVVSTLQKRSPGCAKAMLSEADNFAVNFPNNCTKEDKALIMCAVMFLDFRYFEEKPDRNSRI